MKKPTWIWHYGDFEIHRNMLLAIAREERGCNIPVFWRIDGCSKHICFRKQVDLKEAENICVAMEGVGYIAIDGTRKHNLKSTEIPPGKHEIKISVANPAGLPSVFVSGKTIVSDETWESNSQGLTQTQCDGEFLPVGCGDFNDVNTPPSGFKLPTKEIFAKSVTKIKDGVLVDFGEETFAQLWFEDPPVGSEIKICYGESKPEALAVDEAYLKDSFTADANTKKLTARAFRYIFIESTRGYGNLRAFFEYMPMKDESSFECSDPVLNKIYEISKRTLHLCCREFFVDGIKRDKWVWSGDAYQSYLFNYYSFFDRDIVKRTIIALRGQDPVEANINTILDYNYYWFSSVMEYHQYTGDTYFVKRIYPKMKTMMDFCQARTDKDGFICEREGEWVFIDWANMEKRGKPAAIQILFWRALCSMAYCAGVCGFPGEKKAYEDQAEVLKHKINKAYWNEEKGAYVTSLINKKQCDEVVMHQNLLAVYFGIADDDKKKKILTNVFDNEEIEKITTPYFRFYQSEVMCMMGRITESIADVKKYWKGMLDEGATSFWEEYDPDMKGNEHYAMYGDPYAKSLCHAWGAGPLYLFGRYLLGVKPASVGYESFIAEPQLCGLEYISGSVPANKGRVEIKMDSNNVNICAYNTSGKLIIKSAVIPTGDNICIKKLPGDKYSIDIEEGIEYNIGYSTGRVKF